MLALRCLALRLRSSRGSRGSKEQAAALLWCALMSFALLCSASMSFAVACFELIWRSLLGVALLRVGLQCDALRCGHKAHAGRLVSCLYMFARVHAYENV